MMGDHDNPHKKCSIEEIIEHMTADIQNNDCQYIPLGFTPPPTPVAPHVWSEYTSPANGGGDNHSYASHSSMTMNPGENSMFLSDVSGLQYDINAAHISKQGNEVPQHCNFYYTRQQLNAVTENHEVIGTMVDGGGNIVNVVYSGSNMSPQSYHLMTHDHRDPLKHPLGGFIPYQSGNVDSSPNHMRDYGLFNSSDIQQQSQQNSRQQPPQHFQATVSNRVQLIENLVGNWVPNQSGTYSPFGCMDNTIRPVPSSIQQGIQTFPVPGETEMDYKGVGRGVRKARIVAEVRPMRPTYSDVLTKSAPIALPTSKSNSNSTGTNSANKSDSVNVAKSKTSASKSNNSKKNNKSGTLKRQHSSGSDEHNGSGNLGSSKLIQNTTSSQKYVGSDAKHNNSGIGFNSLPRKWASLDNLDSDKQLTGNLDEELFQPEDLVSSKVLRDSSRHFVGEGSSKKTVGMSGNRAKIIQQDDSNGTTLNNHKPSAYSPGGKGPGGIGGAATKRPPIHINNNLGTYTWAGTSGGGGGGSSGGGNGGAAAAGSIGTGEKNILKGSSGVKNCRIFPDDKKGTWWTLPTLSLGSKSLFAGSRSDVKIGPLGAGSARSGSTRSSSASGTHNSGGSEKPAVLKRRGKKKEVQSPLGLVCRPIKHHVEHWGQIALQVVFWFFHLLSDVLSMSGRLLVHLSAFVYDWLCMWSVQAWKKMSGAVLQLKLFEMFGFRAGWWNFWRSDKSSTNGQSTSGAGDGVNFKNVFPSGLENNISLPSTGDEAMRRLLACKGKDPYSILGVTPHCTDDDIKKYYKRQAVLVHPDKNNQPGAEESFKILVHAFELIGEPERRAAYDRRVAETQQVEQAWSELSELLSQLHKKMEFAANSIRCTNCGKRHRRIHVDRPCYAARFCAQCKIHHNAREGDIWAESSMFGFLWHYYACMDGGVYDITEWAACQADNLRHLRANTHIVQYRIVLGKQSQQQSHGRHHNNRTTHRSAPDSNSEPDLEDFLNNLYNQSGGNGTSGAEGRPDQGRNRRKAKRKK